MRFFYQATVAGQELDPAFAPSLRALGRELGLRAGISLPRPRAAGCLASNTPQVERTGFFCGPGL